MSYASGGLIAASDYNGFVGTSPSSTANQINTIWAVGNGQYGYGQTALSPVSQSGLVTATQWATAVNTLNSIYNHQTGSGTGISAPTSGSLAKYLSTFSSSINTAYSSHLTAYTQGSTTTGTVYSPTATATNGATYNATVATRTVTFSSGDAARYFFNAGGQVNLVVTGVANNDSTARSTDAVTTIATYFGGMSAFKATSNGQRTGTGGTLAGGGYTSGYYSLTTSPQTIAQITSTSSTYTSDVFTLAVKSNGAQGSNADKGSVLTFTLAYASTHSGSWNDTLNITLNHRIDVVYPETTNLSTASWGTVTVA
jgi:hypothetical protein